MKKERLVRPKYRETSSRFSLCRFVIYVLACSQTLYFLFKVRRAWVIKYKPQGGSRWVVANVFEKNEKKNKTTSVYRLFMSICLSWIKQQDLAVVILYRKYQARLDLSENWHLLRCSRSITKKIHYVWFFSCPLWFSYLVYD